MSNFDYITSKDFKKSLISDYAEMKKCAESKSWKSAQVIAGSIVECLLIDYIISTNNPNRPTKDPLKMDLSEAISICKQEGVLSDRTADLCSVIRSYRNLIHPGRVIRLNETPPDKNTCNIAIALIDLIIDDIAKKRLASVGFTAEQIVSKIIKDENCLAILDHLLEEVTNEQRIRLLIEVIPTAYFEEDESFGGYIRDRMSSAYRLIFESSSKEIKETVSLLFVRMLKEDSGSNIGQYKNAFFRGSDLEYLDGNSCALVKKYIVGTMPVIHTARSLNEISGIGKFLEEHDCLNWCDSIIRTITSANTPSSVREEAKKVFFHSALQANEVFIKKLSARLIDWKNHFTKLESQNNLDLTNELISDISFLIL